MPAGITPGTPPPGINVGGQAVVEGVMMRSPRSYAVVCRRPSGEIVIRERPWKPLWAGARILKLPLLRGAVVLCESVANGLDALSFAAAQQLPEADRERGGGPVGGVAIALGVVLALGLFVAGPHLLTGLFGFNTTQPAFHLVDGALRATMLLGYLALLGRLPEARRLFAYHGAEHKAIAAYEAGLPLTVENARSQSRFHPRCGTSFLLLVILVSSVIFALVFRAPLGGGSRLLGLLTTLAIKIPLLIPVAGVSYEALRLSGRFGQNPVVRALIAPGLWLQRLTTREPDDSQLEISLVAVRKTLAREAAILRADETQVPAGVEVFPSYAAITLPA
jgi:uncharacterized protein YqhQ